MDGLELLTLIYWQIGDIKMELINQIAKWIVVKVKEAGLRGAVVGMSGGIDSSVTVALCQKALGENVLGAILPCESSPTDAKDAAKVAALCGVQTEVVNLEKIYALLLKSLPAGSELAAANLKPRLRMMCLYYLAALNSSLVVGSGNKSELMVGYFTKYGDGGADLLPLGGLYKTKVRKLAYDLNLPEDIIKKPPSAGLWKEQTDEGELGITYEMLDHTLMAIEAQETKDINSDVLTHVQKLTKQASHKLNMPPIFRRQS